MRMTIVMYASAPAFFVTGSSCVRDRCCAEGQWAGAGGRGAEGQRAEGAGLQFAKCTPYDEEEPRGRSERERGGSMSVFPKEFSDGRWAPDQSTRIWAKGLPGTRPRNQEN
ncbi:hypothetical protein KM043_000821 [Ampulex compressa]|nr:hypothetical protein KM043_000821 [Ampulex compressa]